MHPSSDAHHADTGQSQGTELARAAGFGPLPLDVLPSWSVPLFVSGIVVSGVTAALLNAVLREDEAAA